MGGTTATGTPGTALDPIAYPSPPGLKSSTFPEFCAEREKTKQGVIGHIRALRRSPSPPRTPSVLWPCTRLGSGLAPTTVGGTPTPHLPERMNRD